MKRVSSFQRIGRVFGLTSSVDSKYTRRGKIGGKEDKYAKGLYYKTVDQNSDIYSIAKDMVEIGSSKLVLQDAHDNYGCMSLGINQLYNEDKRETDLKKIDQFNEKLNYPRPWHDEPRDFEDYTPIPQENVPLCAQGSFEEKRLDPKDRLKFVTIKKGLGFQPSFPNRPIKHVDGIEELVKENKDKTCAVMDAMDRWSGLSYYLLNIKTEDLHGILSRTKEIKITTDVNIVDTWKTSTEGATGKKGSVTIRYNSKKLSNSCPPTCQTTSNADTYACCMQDEQEVLKETITGKRTVTLKRFHEYTELSDEGGKKLDISRNLFTEAKRYMLARRLSCEEINPTDYEEPDYSSYEAIKYILEADPKETLDAGCLTTSLLYDNHYYYKIDPSLIVDDKANVDLCKDGGYQETYNNFSGINDALDWGRAGSQIVSPIGYGPRLDFYYNSKSKLIDYVGAGWYVNNGVAGIEKYDFPPKKQGEWIKIWDKYLYGPCSENELAYDRYKLNSNVATYIDPISRPLDTMVEGSCIYTIWGQTFCGEKHNEPCTAELDVCSGVVTTSNGCKDCTGKTDCEVIYKTSTYGHPFQSKRLPTEEFQCPEENKKCCSEENKDEEGTKYIHDVVIRGGLGMVAKKQSETINAEELYSIPISDYADNTDLLKACFVYDISIGGRRFFLSQEAAERAGNFSNNSIGEINIKKGGEITFKFEKQEYKTDLKTLYFVNKGAAANFTIAQGTQVDHCTTSACGYKSSPYASPCDCEDPCAEGYVNTCGCNEAVASLPASVKGIRFPCVGGFSGGPENKSDVGCSGCYTYTGLLNCDAPPCCGKLGNDGECDCADLPDCTTVENASGKLSCPSLEFTIEKAAFNMNNLLGPERTSDCKITIEFIPFTS